MNNLNREYLQLLNRQVEDEIQFLKANNHSTKQNYVPCIFCSENRDKSYNCNRLNELREFQSNIEVRLNQHRPSERRSIGYEIPDMTATRHPEFKGQTLNCHLPQLLQPL